MKAEMEILAELPAGAPEAEKSIGAVFFREAYNAEPSARSLLLGM